MRLGLTFASAFMLCGCMAAISSVARAQPQMRDPTQILERADLDGDGRITRAEFTEARARTFAQLDRNKDGYLDKADASGRRFGRNRGGAGAGERLQQAMDFIDTDGDGRISRDEFVGGRAIMFDRADANGDNVIDEAEMRAFRDTIASYRDR